MAISLFFASFAGGLTKVSFIKISSRANATPTPPEDISAEKRQASPPTPAPEEHNPRADTARTLNDDLANEAADVFAGIEVTEDQQGLIIHVIDSGRQRVQSIVERDRARLGPSALPDNAISYQSATASLASLKSRRDTLTAAADKLRGEGVQLVSWGPEVRRNVLRVGVENPSSDTQQKVADEVGADNLIVEGSAPATPSNRKNDSPPWWGGDSLVTPSLGSCTSGFSVADNSGVTYNTSAAHCGNGTFQQGDWREPSYTWVGYGVTVQSERPNNGVGDSQTISTYPNSSAGRVFTAYSTSVAVGSIDTATQNEGELYCSDGYFTGEVCNAIIARSDICVTFTDGVTTCGLIDGTVRGGATLVQHGDSGGPVYNYNGNGTLNARGLITGQTGSTCCSDEEYYTQIATPEWFFGVHVLLG